jgi:sterol desaturase/sphingolipid hydroxylase (fatty acid hydroxylase superfamily)
MESFVATYEGIARLVFFVGIFVGVAMWENRAPRRDLTTSKPARWLGNLGIVGINTIVLRLLFPVAAVGTAVYVGEKGWGLFNNVSVPYWLAVLLSAVILDFVIYVQHVIFHAIPALWRLHMMHHADLDYDLTTGTRFHPIEILLSMVLKIAAVVVLGAPALGVLIFEILLNGTAMFNHGNIRLPLGIDRVLRWFVVTPDMHRVHHSVFPTEANSNFGFNLPWWDRMMGTYKPQPTKGHLGMTIGLNQFRDPNQLTLPWMLALPFVGKTGNYPINRRGAKQGQE